MLEEWIRPDSVYRVFLTSQIDDDDLVVLDLENIVILGRGPIQHRQKPDLDTVDGWLTCAVSGAHT